MSQYESLHSILLESPLLAPIIEDWEKLELPDCWLVAGSLAQTVWNHVFNLPLAYGISDVDIVYFEPHDLSQGTEARHAARIRKAFSHLPVWIDVKNEARVHLWYAAKFGSAITPYTSTVDAITTFPTTATAIGLRKSPHGLRLSAPFGVDDLLRAVVRPNKKQIRREIYEAKISRWIKIWPNLTIIEWDADPSQKSAAKF
ncbi:nucleotidyltransferase family protein [Mesorhizobium koreense]|uniref:nucleotidyltransferase family protein n=1 Tax=Mesorhizobium koreense TaxID=3074855 RepID=UPI00287B7491|nr:nucleotidyltransferase family protein [Mesorhizobium sp. WR6]